MGLSRRHEALLAFWHLARLRLAMSAFNDEWGSILQGNLWGARIEDAAARVRMMVAREWYEQERRRLR